MLALPPTGRGVEFIVYDMESNGSKAMMSAGEHGASRRYRGE